MDEKLRQQELQCMENYFFCSSNWQRVKLTMEWAKSFPAEAGVYILFHKRKPVYVGETGRISGRMSDLRNTKNHTVRRSIGKERFSNCAGYKRAKPKRDFPEHIEKLVEGVLCEFYVCAKPVNFGRKEIEEHFVSKCCPKYNQRKKRN